MDPCIFITEFQNYLVREFYLSWYIFNNNDKALLQKVSE